MANPNYTTGLSSISSSYAGEADIPTAHIQQFTSSVLHLAQQKKSRLRPVVRTEIVKGELAAFERLGTIDAQTRTARYQTLFPAVGGNVTGDTAHNQPQWDRRWVTLEDIYEAVLVEKIDSKRMLADPASNYVRAMAAGLGRKIDDVIITAALGNAYTGHNFSASTFTAWNSTTGTIVNADGMGLTISKLREAKTAFWGNEVDADELYLVVSGKQINDLLGDDRATSADFNSVRALVNGEINQFMGFTFIRSERLSTKDNDPSIRRCFAFTRDAITLAINEDVTSRVTERADLHYNKQIYMSMSVGAVRMEEAQVVEIECVET